MEKNKERQIEYRWQGYNTQSYLSRQVGSESVKVPATQAASEKVANMVGTFLKKNGNGFQKIRITTKV